MKILAIGDMHRKVKDALALIDFGLEHGYDKIVFVGDYADNFQGDARDTFALWDTLTAQPKDVQDRLVPLMGNHDYAYAHASEMKMLYGTNQVQSGFDPLTLLGMDVAYEKYLCDHLALTACFDNVWYSHAGITQRWLDEEPKRDEILKERHPSRPLAIVDYTFHSPYSPLWTRPDYGYLGLSKRAISKTEHRILEIVKPSPYPPITKQVFGHTPVTTCVNLHTDGNCWCIDTFSQHRSGDNIGDRSVLEVIDGKHFRVIPESEWANVEQRTRPKTA